MRKGVFILFILLTTICCIGQNENKVIRAIKISEVPKIDGKLDDNAWKQVSPNEDFIVTAPQYGTKPQYKTQIYLAYTDEALYIAARLFIEPKHIRKQLTKRDGELRKDVDYFAVFFDTAFNPRSFEAFGKCDASRHFL